MRLFTAVVLSALVATACQKKGAEDDGFQSTKLSVGVEEVDASLNLNNYSKSVKSYVTKADLWCQDKLKASLDFSADAQSIELFASLENCELRLTEFVYGETYKLGSLFSQGVYEFELRNPADNSLIDKKLVRAIQPITVGNKGKCSGSCEFKEIHVKFPHSVLDIKKEVLVSDVNVNELYTKLEKENAPTCDSLSARFVESADLITAPSLEIVLKNCTNTIGSGELEFAFGGGRLTPEGDLPGPVNAADVMDAINRFPIVPVKKGNDYIIKFTFDELKAKFDLQNISVIDFLTFDYIVLVRNKGGISGLIYLIDNQCQVKGGKI